MIVARQLNQGMLIGEIEIMVSAIMDGQVELHIDCPGVLELFERPNLADPKVWYGAFSRLIPRKKNPRPIRIRQATSLSTLRIGASILPPSAA